MIYNWQLLGWPIFEYNTDVIEVIVLELTKELGELDGILKALPDSLKQETILQLMIAEALKTSEIEGEYLSREDVMSSIRNNLGWGHRSLPVKDQRASSISALMVEVRNTYQEPMTEIMLRQWHKLLMDNVSNIRAGAWRIGQEPMQVISGAHGREVVHYEAPPSDRLPEEMSAFIHWFNNATFDGKNELADAILRSAISHLYFESIHPFEDGNGRIGRAIAEKALSMSLKRPIMLSLSKVIEKDKKAYYNALKAAQRKLDLTDWISYFSTVILNAQKEAKQTALFTLKKARFYDRYQGLINDRQKKVINKMLEKGAEGFEGGMTAAKYMAITKASKATATRDLQQLLENKALVQEGGGRSIRYQLNI